MSFMLSGLKGEYGWGLAIVVVVAGLVCLGLSAQARTDARRIWVLASGAARGRAIWPRQFVAALGRRDRRRAMENSSEEARQQNIRLQAALRHMSQGLCLFDGQRRLIFCNARFADMFALPSKLTQPGVTLREIMDYQVASGSYPGSDPDEFVREMLRIASENKSLKSLVEFRDGRFIAASHEPTAEGGWVATFEDVTERLRAVGELRETRAAMIEARAEAERAAQRAQAAHQRLQEAFDLMPEGVVLFDSQDRHVLWNRRYAELTAPIVEPLVAGMRFEDVVRRGIALGRYPQAAGWEEQWLAMRRALHAMPHSSHEQRLAGDRWLRIEERRTADGGCLGVRIDITELKRREASFKLLFDSNPLPMLVCDQETLRFLAVNEAAIKHYGYSREEFLSMSTLDIRLPEDWERVRKAFGKNEGECATGETWRHRKKDGTLIEVAVRKQNLSYECRASILLAVIDMTEQRRAEEEIRQTRMFLDAIIENIPASIVVKDARDFSYVLINRAAEEFYGISRDEVIGKNVYEIYPKETADRIAASYRVLFAGRPQISDEHEVETPANGLRLVTTKSLPVFGENGLPQYVLTVIDDITERRRAERRVAHLAHHDALTDLPNRAAFAALLTETIQ
ncbi:MAG: PAS-domain containing protein [Roseiarcus sp.]|jgi:PAS domain S-box-containing protein